MLDVRSIAPSLVDRTMDHYTPASFAVEPLDDAGLWLVRYTGKTTLEVRKMALAHFVKVSVGHPVLGIIVDLTQADLHLSTADAFEFGNNLAEERGLRQCRLVFLERPENGLRSRFMETVAINRGRDTRVVTDYDEAVAWLMEAPIRTEALQQDLQWPPAQTGS